MAETKSITYTAQETAQSNAGKIIADAALISGKSLNIQCEVEVPSGTSSNDTILLGFIPAGATIIPGNCSVTVPVAAGASTVKLGFADDDDAIASGISVNTAGSQTLNSTVSSYKNTSRQALIAKLGGSLTAGRKLYFNIAYAFAE